MDIIDVFQKLCTDNLKIQLDKCEFLREEAAYLGDPITLKCVKPNPSKVDDIPNFGKRRPRKK